MPGARHALEHRRKAVQRDQRRWRGRLAAGARVRLRCVRDKAEKISRARAALSASLKPTLPGIGVSSLISGIELAASERPVAVDHKPRIILPDQRRVERVGEHAADARRCRCPRRYGAPIPTSATPSRPRARGIACRHDRRRAAEATRRRHCTRRPAAARPPPGGSASCHSSALVTLRRRPTWRYVAREMHADRAAYLESCSEICATDPIFP